MCACEMKVRLNQEFLDTRSGIRIGDRLGSSSPISISTTAPAKDLLNRSRRVEMFAGAEG